MEHVQTALDNYEKGMGLPSLEKSPCEEDELSGYLCMSKDEMDVLAIEDCDKMAMRLAQSVIYIRRLYNKGVSRISWCDTEISHYICDKINTVGGQYDKFDIKLGILAKTDNYLGQLIKFKSYAAQRQLRLQDIANDINNMKFVVLELKKTKMREK